MHYKHSAQQRLAQHDQNMRTSTIKAAPRDLRGKLFSLLNYYSSYRLLTASTSFSLSLYAIKVVDHLFFVAKATD